MGLPVIPSCALDGEGTKRQLERYRRAGDDADVLERTRRRLIVRVAPSGTAVVPQLVEVESQCCSFFGLDWDPDSRQLSISVSERQHEPALAAIAHALGV